MPDSASDKRPSTPVAISLAVMLLACALILTALLLLAQGAVARDARPGRATPADGMVSGRTATAHYFAPIPSSALNGEISGSFVLGAPLSPEDTALETSIALSSTGGGFIVGDAIHIVVNPIDLSSGETAR